MTNAVVYTPTKDGRITAVFADRIGFIGYGKTEAEAKAELMDCYMKRLGDVPAITTVSEPSMVHTARFTGNPELCHLIGQSLHSKDAAEQKLAEQYRKRQNYESCKETLTLEQAVGVVIENKRPDGQTKTDP